ncbi:Dihydrolipoamide dehydrogenase of 2-oxoglutarate dehydrogenase [hydrothermal vent metagenome]|uniref:Dihydrolipoyl dehydrogenase n=1 Tax=hydrothermal vent metagenome TaxID=652676 RepID=A0A3B0YQ91_9ZZZZ
MSDQYQVIVVGAGPAGYVAAIRCAQLGLKTVCIDAWTDAEGKSALGGTCLNVGCIPSKALLESSEQYEFAQGGLSAHGIGVTDVSLDLDVMMQRKQRIVRELTQGIAQLFKANGVTHVQGRAQLCADRRVVVSHENSTTTLQADQIILAPGSSPVQLPGVDMDNEYIVDSAGALSLAEVPSRLGIIGAGVIGLELGSVWRRLGTEQVVLLEAQENFLAVADEQVAKQALRSFTGQGLDIRLGSRVTSCEVSKRQVELRYQDDGGDHDIQFDRLIVAVGRCPATAGLAADEAGLLFDEWGFIHVDESCRTNLPGVWAIGDAVRGPMLAHKGSEEGMMVAERIAGQVAQLNYDTIPSVVYTHPEIAWVGQTEQALRAAGVAYRSGMFPFSASGRARAMGDTEGFIKVLSDEKTDRILGVHIIGPQSSELIAEAVIAMQLGGSVEDIALTTFAHPALSEAFHEAALAAHGRAIHVAPARTRKSGKKPA